MNETTHQAGSQIVALACAVRFGFIALVGVISILNFCHAPLAHDMEPSLIEIVGGKPLPPITAFVIHHDGAFIFLAAFVPFVALVSAFVSRPHQSIHISASLLVIAFGQLYTTAFALAAPSIAVMSYLR
jgi:hypothetical protein